MFCFFPDQFFQHLYTSKTGSAVQGLFPAISPGRPSFIAQLHRFAKKEKAPLLHLACGRGAFTFSIVYGECRDDNISFGAVPSDLLVFQMGLYR